MTLISVIIPCYNSSKTLRNTLDSIVQQDCTCDFEVIVSDDNSDDIDKIKLILHDYQNKFKTLILIESNENLGGGAARNKAIDIATGSYIAFLDSDDLWYKDKISTQINLYKSGSILTSRVHKGKSLDAAKVLPDIVKNEAEPISDALFISNKLIQTSTFFMESSIAKLVKFNSDLPRHQDYDFLLRAE
ncbi:glycosyltransferase family 2 protein, partial [Providencia rettgeri]|nr:glycosyltransferase family 2 protein [Providencia rettgeri]